MFWFQNQTNPTGSEYTPSSPNRHYSVCPLTIVFFEFIDYGPGLNMNYFKQFNSSQ